MSRPLSPAMILALMEVTELGYSPAEAARRNNVAQSGISRQLNKKQLDRCKECGQVIKDKKGYLYGRI